MVHIFIYGKYWQIYSSFPQWPLSLLRVRLEQSPANKHVNKQVNSWRSLFSPFKTLLTCLHALTRTEVSNVDCMVVNRITQLDIHHGGPSLGVCVKLPNLVSEMQWCHCNKTSYESVVDNSCIVSVCEADLYILMLLVSPLVTLVQKKRCKCSDWLALTN